MQLRRRALQIDGVSLTQTAPADARQRLSNRGCVVDRQSEPVGAAKCVAQLIEGRRCLPVEQTEQGSSNIESLQRSRRTDRPSVREGGAAVTVIARLKHQTGIIG